MTLNITRNPPAASRGVSQPADRPHVHAGGESPFTSIHNRADVLLSPAADVVTVPRQEPIKNSGLHSLHLPAGDGEMPTAEGLFVVLDGIAREKRARYKDYLHYGYNPQDHHDILTTLKHLPASSGLSEAARASVTELASAINVLMSLLFSVEQREALLDQQRAQLASREALVQRLIAAVALLPDLFQLADDTLRRAEHRQIENTLTDELIAAALQRINRADAATAERDLRQMIASPNPAMAERLKRLIGLNLAKAVKPQRKSHRLALSQIEKTCKATRGYLNKDARQSAAQLPVPADMLWAMLLVCDRLEALMPDLRAGYHRRQPPPVPGGNTQRWIAPTGLRLSFPASILSKAICRGVKKTADKWQTCHSQLNREGPALFKTSKTRAFLSLSEEQREMCIAARQRVAPLLALAAELVTCATSLDSAVQNACRAAIAPLTTPLTVEQALQTELRLLLDDTPEVRLLQAIAAARAMAKQCLNHPSLPADGGPQPAAPDRLAQIIAEYVPDLTRAALLLAKSADLAEKNLHSADVRFQLDYVKRMGSDLGVLLRNALESVTGTGLRSDWQWLNKLEAELHHHWQPVTTLLGKGKRNYYLAQPTGIDSRLRQSLPRSVLPLLNLLEKLRMQCRQMEAVIRLTASNDAAAGGMINAVAGTLRQLDLSPLQQSAENLKRVFRDHPQPVQIHTSGPDQAQPLSAEAVLLSDIQAIQTAMNTLTDAAALLRWNPRDAVAARLLARVRADLDALRKDIKDAVQAVSGFRLNNYSPEGMIARDAGEWAAQLRKDWQQRQLPTETQHPLNQQLEATLRQLSQSCAAKDDPGGERLHQRIGLAIGDAMRGELTWPATADELLSQTKTQKAYTLAWAEKRLTYAMLFNLLVYHTPVAMFSTRLLRNSLVSPLRIINLLLTPLSSIVTRRAMNNVRPGSLRDDHAIDAYHSRVVFQTVFRTASMLAPQLLKTVVAAGIASWGLANGGDYRRAFLSRALSRLPADMFWASGFSASRQLTTLLSPPTLPGAAAAVTATAQQQDTLRKACEHLNPLQRMRHGPAETPENGRTGRLRRAAPLRESLPSTPAEVNDNISYKDFTGEKRKSTYFYGIKFLLSKIEHDESLPENIRENAGLALLGAPLLVPVDIYGSNLNNTFLIPDSAGAKTGLLVRVSADTPYCLVASGADLPAGLKANMPHNAHLPTYSFIGFEEYDYPSGHETLENIRNGAESFAGNFNYNNSAPLHILDLASQLENQIAADYTPRNSSPENTRLISRAVAGSHLPDPGVSVTPVTYTLQFTWENLTPAEYLRSFARPFSVLSGEMQLVASSVNGESLQETDRHVHQAEYIGSWIDVTTGAVTAFNPVGWVLNIAKSAADIAADVVEGKSPDPVAVAGLVLSCIPGGKVAAKIGKFSSTGGKVAKYGLLLGNKAIDLTQLGESIVTAFKTGEPLAIYQALLSSGMNVESAWKLLRQMCTTLKFSKQPEESATLQHLQAIHNNAPEFALRENMPVRQFKIGQTELLGVITGNTLHISGDNGTSWQQGNALHLLAYRLQNAGGRRQLADITASAVNAPGQASRLHLRLSTQRSLTFDNVTDHRITLTTSTRWLLQRKYSTTKVRTFDDASSTFKNSDAFTIVRNNYGTKKIGHMPAGTLPAAIADMQHKTDHLLNQLKGYTGSDKEIIANNLRVTQRGLEGLSQEIAARGGDRDLDIFTLIRKDTPPDAAGNYYGLAAFQYNVDRADMEIKFLTAHPYSTASKSPEFTRYLIANDSVTASDLRPYKIKGVAKYLGGHSLRAQADFYESIPHTKIKTLSFSGANPITQKLGYDLEGLLKPPTG